MTVSPAALAPHPLPGSTKPLNDAFLLGARAPLVAAPFLGASELSASVGHNTGNLCFVHAIDQHLGGGLPRYRRGDAHAVLDAASGTAVLPCANHLGVHADLRGEAEHFARMRQPIVAIGLGAQSGPDLRRLPELAEGSLRWLRVLAEHAPSSAPNIAVRGEFTLRLLKHYGLAERAVELGCPTLFLNPRPDLGRLIARSADGPIRRVAVAAGHYLWKHMNRLEASLARIVERTHGAYVLQSPREMLMLYRQEIGELPAATLEALRLPIAPEAVGLDIADWYRRYAVAFFDVPAWMNFLRGFDFVVGARIHGVMLALQVGVPALCIAHDSRTLELCRTMAVPHVTLEQVVEGVDLDGLRRLFRFDPVAFDARRAELARRYERFLAGNGLTLAPGYRGMEA